LSQYLATMSYRGENETDTTSPTPDESPPTIDLNDIFGAQPQVNRSVNPVVAFYGAMSPSIACVAGLLIFKNGIIGTALFIFGMIGFIAFVDDYYRHRDGRPIWSNALARGYFIGLAIYLAVLLYMERSMIATFF
jgi:hypothetical protein